MNPYWNNVATPYLFAVILFGMYVLFMVEPGYAMSQSGVNSAAAVLSRKGSNSNAQNAVRAIGSLGRAGNPQK